MADEYQYPKLTLRITSQKGHCAMGHQVGQEYDVSAHTPAGMCPFAFNAAFPFIFAMMVGGVMPWEPDKDVAHSVCPDPVNPVEMEIRRSLN